MKTNHPRDPEFWGLTARGVVWLLCLTLAAASGCAGCTALKEDLSRLCASTDLPITECNLKNCHTSVEYMKDGCELPECDSSPHNGNGVYVREEGNYCFLFGNEETYCPTAFRNTPTGVMLEFLYNKQPTKDLPPNTVSAVKRGKGMAPQEVKVVSFSGENSRLTLHYALKDNPSKPIPAMGDELKDFTFQVTVDDLRSGSGEFVEHTFVTYEFTVKQEDDVVVKQEGGVPQKGNGAFLHASYTLRYHDITKYGGTTPDQPWRVHCQRKEVDPQDYPPQVSFLPGERVIAKTGFAKPDSQVLTMACQTGAIATCLSWGYAPWTLDGKGQIDDNRNYTYRSCLQAKRAAYFVGIKPKNDPTHTDDMAYTTTGTPIFLRDHYGYGTYQCPLPPHLEAIWSPNGVVCLNLEELRHKERFGTTVTAQAQALGVRPCQPVDWGLKGALATGAQSRMPPDSKCTLMPK